ncbi:proteasome endopeptidase complex, archaeal, alpha subunit [archaeon]|nr:proteasome endopeptidase complex, archaeal, alpha subunit [archaeon]|tara:strand:+ start:2845 stop:3561 length:717 start_codon:yes stop_codon:yes gene_type:complete
MQPVQHQMMGYDRTSTMFSPDGRLLQVEYAKKTVKQGTTAIGMVCNGTVILVADKRLGEELIVPKSVEKVFQVDQHIGATASGILSDGRILVDKARLIAQQHQVTYDTQMDTEMLVKDICDMKQAFTQYGGARPFGVSILFGGIDDDAPVLFLTDPTGIFFQYKATAIGENENDVKEILNKEYKDNLTMEEGIKLCVKALKSALGKDFELKRLDVAYVSASDKEFRRLDINDIKKAIK